MDFEKRKNMPKRKPNDVFAEFDKILFAYRAVGLCTLIRSLGEFRTSKKWLIYSSFTLLPLLVFNVCVNYFLFLKDDDSLISYLNTARTILVVLCSFSTWLLNIIEVKNLNRCLKKIQLVDYYLVSVGERIPLSKSSKAILLGITSLTLPFTLWASSFKHYINYIILVLLFHPLLLMSMAHLLLDRLLTILFLRYQAIINALHRLHLLRENDSAELLERMNFCFESLYSSGELMEDFFALQILIILTSAFIISFSEIYSTIQLFYFEMHSKEEDVISEIASHVSGAVISIITIWQIGYRFSSITEKADEFHFLLYRLMMEDKTNRILYNEKLNLHFLMRREVVFTAYGFFKLDFSLVHSIIASATTYLVLLVQFGQLSPPERSAKPNTSTFSNLTTVLPTTTNYS